MLLGGCSRRHGSENIANSGIPFAPVLPLFLITVVQLQQLSIQAVYMGVGHELLCLLLKPAQQTILNRIASSSVQKAVSAATAVGFLLKFLDWDSRHY